MKHLHPWSVLEGWDELPGSGSRSCKTSALGLDGYELFTTVDEVPDAYCVPEVVAAHLPYAIDWRSSWEGRHYEGQSGDQTYFSFGRDREEMVANLTKAINFAAKVRPAYGVLHAGNTDMRQVLHRKHVSDDLKVLGEFAEFVNTVMSGMPGGEPPFRLAFENLWWEGLKLVSPTEWQFLEKKIEFDSWGFTLDTGHLMNTRDDIFDEDSAIDSVMKVIDAYPSDMKDRIGTMHLQFSSTVRFRNSIVDEDMEDYSYEEYWEKAYARAWDIDQHHPFTSRRVNEIVDSVKPGYLNHELLGGGSGDRYADLRLQRSLFN